MPASQKTRFFADVSADLRRCRWGVAAVEKRMGWGWGVVSRRRCRAGRRSGRSSGRMGIVCRSSGAPVYAVALSRVA